MHEIIYWSTVAAPRGDCIVIATDKAIIWTGTPGSPFAEAQSYIKSYFPTAHIIKGVQSPVLKKALKELSEYLQGKRIDFSGPFALHGTPFQVAVWKQMLQIPYGKTITYGELAKRVGKPNASRAVGGACNKNPIAILVPCHRVVGSTGALTGYGGGLPTKKWLLELEKAIEKV